QRRAGRGSLAEARAGAEGNPHARPRERDGGPGMGTEMSKQPTIARIWRGRVRRERADEYEKYNYDVGIVPLIEKALGVQTFREDREHESELMTISYWEDIPAMARFPGRDPTDIHHLDRDPEFLIELPKSVQIIRLLTSHGKTGWG